MKVKDVLTRLHSEGWTLARHRGSHRQFVHQDRPGKRVTVSGKPGLDIPHGTRKSIFNQAGWT